MFVSFLATYNDLIVGVLYLLTYKEMAYVWYAGSLPGYYEKHPNDILYWEAIKWSCRNGYKIFDFGGAGSPNEEYGVREFKKQFGGELVNYGRFEKSYRPHFLKIIKAYLKVRQAI
jgi:lipid II:glycine glycyltransferase (peptidoglycan interpeptide bridge formation enzyme)